MSVGAEFMNAMLGGQQFQQNQQLMQQRSQQMSFLQAEEPARIADMQATAQKAQLDAKLQKQRMDADAEFSRILADEQRDPSKGALTPSDILKQQADYLVEHGLGHDAMDAYQKSAEYAGRTADAAEKQANLYATERATTADMLVSGASAQELASYLTVQAPELMKNPEISKTVRTLLDNPGMLDANNGALRQHMYEVLTTQKQRDDLKATVAKTKADNAYATHQAYEDKLLKMELGEDDKQATALKKAGGEAPKTTPTKLASFLGASGVLTGTLPERIMEARSLMDQFPGLSNEDYFDKLVELRQQAAAGKGVQQAQYQRIINASNEMVRDLENISKMPAGATVGLVAGMPTEGGITDLTKSMLTRKFTPLGDQLMNIVTTGLARNAGTIEAAGSAYGIAGLSEQIGKQLAPQPGAPVYTRLTQLAQAAQIADAGLETLLNNPAVPKQEKQFLTDLRTKMKEAVPFTVRDLLEMKYGKVSDAETLGGVARRMGLGDSVVMKAPDGTEGYVPKKRVKDYQANGYTLAGQQ